MSNRDKIKALKEAKKAIQGLQEKERQIFTIAAGVVGIDPDKINNHTDILWDVLFNDFGKINKDLLDKLK